MDWKEKLDKREKEVAEKREQSANLERSKNDILMGDIQKAIDDLGIIERLKSIRDEIWGAGDITQELTMDGFEAVLYYDYPEYFPKRWVSSGNIEGGSDVSRIPPSIDFKRETLKIKLFLNSMGASLRIYFSFADYDLLEKREFDISKKYGTGFINNFWKLHDSEVLVCDFKLGQDLTFCKDNLDKELLDYCAIKSFLPRMELLERKSKNVSKALKGELPVEQVNQDAVNVLREAGLLQEDNEETTEAPK